VSPGGESLSPHAATAAAATTAARASYGRLLAWLAWQWRDIAAAEDALGEAFATALQRWPQDGVPASPEGWLLTAAKRQLLMAARRQRLADDPTLTVLRPGHDDAAPELAALPDHRLRLMFVCTHPAIAVELHCALMLQTVLGLDAALIASAFLVSPQAMAKRLVRAKAKIKASGIRFEEPSPDEWPERVQGVLEAIYAAYVLDASHMPEARAGELADEALYLAELVAAQLPRHAEALGLLALLRLCQARKPARRNAAGEFVPLDQQDCTLWDAPLVALAHQQLTQAAALHEVGPFQLEAAIQSAHHHRAVSGHTPWADIVQLYQQLLAMAPTIGACIGHAVALARAHGDPALGLGCLDDIAAASVHTHQPWWAARAHLLQALGRDADAAQAYDRAMALTTDPALRQFLRSRMQR
jgi:RNA polymerase sigma-70 factor, ECF subfamily